jgi:hypothetical protein
MTGIAAIAAWTGPMLVVAVVARVTAGGAEAPLFVLAVLAAPLLALLAGPAPEGTRSSVTFVVGAVTIACVLTAGFRAVTDVGHALGLEVGAVLGSAVVLVVATTVSPGHRRVGVVAFALGVAALATALAIVGIAAAASPWTVWSRLASRGPFELSPRSPWTGEGAHFPEAITLSFTEPHRIAAVAPATLRVTEHDRAAVGVRDWRLRAGESLSVRPGDSVSIPAGARLRFEAGKRVPGLPPSGVAWADSAGAPRPRLLVWWLWLTVTLGGGALLIVRLAGPPSRAAAVLGPLGLLAVTLAATCWGLYALDAAPELAIGAAPASTLARLAPILVDEPWRSRLVAAVALALLALFLGSAASLRQRLADLAGAGGRLAGALRGGVLGATVWVGLVVAAAAASTAVADGWTVLLHGAGLAAATVLGPFLATGDRPGSERARVSGALVGAAVLVVATAIARWPAASAGGLHAAAQYPALLAVPAAWLVTTLSRGTKATRGGLVAAARRR